MRQPDFLGRLTWGGRTAGRQLRIGGLVLLLSWLGLSCQQRARPAEVATALPRPAPAVQVVRTAEGGFALLRHGRRFRIKGGAGLQYYDRLRAAGGNSVRLWSTNYAGPLLDSAQRQGLSVMLGLWMVPENAGFDYDDAAAVQAQLADLRTQIVRYRYHPALLMWCVGNELDVGARNSRVCAAINDVAKLIHELDPDHPVTTAITADLALVPALKRWAPAIDILSVNSYAKLAGLSAKIQWQEWDKPYIVSEFGSRGYWPDEYKLTPWRAPLEQTSTEKAAYIRQRHQQTVVEDSARCLGAYVFYWGHKMEQTPTWFSLFTARGEKTALVDEMHWLWRGRYPADRAPAITQLTLNGQHVLDFPRLKTNATYEAAFRAHDAEGQPLRARWELWPELPTKPDSLEYRGTEPLAGAITEVKGNRALLRTPRQAGAYRLLLWVSDGQGGVATANIPFYCLPARLARR